MSEFGHRWFHIAERLPGRTDHAIRNRYHRLQTILQKNGPALGAAPDFAGQPASHVVPLAPALVASPEPGLVAPPAPPFVEAEVLPEGFEHVPLPAGFEQAPAGSADHGFGTVSRAGFTPVA